MSISVPRRSAVLGRLSDISKLPRTARCCWENAKSNEKEKNNNNYEYYNVCLNCADKIVELMKYNHGFGGRLIQYLESLKNEK